MLLPADLSWTHLVLSVPSRASKQAYQDQTADSCCLGPRQLVKGLGQPVSRLLSLRLARVWLMMSDMSHISRALPD